MFDLNFLPRLAHHFSGGFVLAFHDLEPARFVDLVECLAPFEPVHLAELVDRARKGRPNDGLFAITIDDGVGETVRGLFAVLAERRWPATFYLPTQYLDTGAGMPFQWWRTLLPLPRRALELPSGMLDLSGPHGADRLERAMHSLWHTARKEAYLPLTMELVDYLGGRRLPPAPITWPEVERMSRSELVRFESHGVSHTALSALTEPEIAEEMRRSRDIIGEWTGRECRHFAYPFGSPQSIGPVAPQIARRYFDSAVTMVMRGVEAADPWELPRIPLYPANSRTVARLKIVLKGCSLRRMPPQVETETGLTAAPRRQARTSS